MQVDAKGVKTKLNRKKQIFFASTKFRLQLEAAVQEPDDFTSAILKTYSIAAR